MRTLAIALLVTTLPAAAYAFQAPTKPVMAVAVTPAGIAAPAAARESKIATPGATPGAKPAAKLAANKLVEPTHTDPNTGNEPATDRKYDPPLCAPAIADWNPAFMANGAACAPSRYAGLGQSRG